MFRGCVTIVRRVIGEFDRVLTVVVAVVHRGVDIVGHVVVVVVLLVRGRFDVGGDDEGLLDGTFRDGKLFIEKVIGRVLRERC